MQNIFREMAQKAVAENICAPFVGCGQPINDKDFTDELSKAESKISGLCQGCQDRAFAED